VVVHIPVPAWQVGTPLLSRVIDTVTESKLIIAVYLRYSAHIQFMCVTAAVYRQQLYTGSCCSTVLQYIGYVARFMCCVILMMMMNCWFQ